MDDTCRFELELTEGNNPFPEADINIYFYDGDGNPITTSNVMARPSSGENIIGTADTHAHLYHNKGSVQSLSASAIPRGTKCISIKYNFS